MRCALECEAECLAVCVVPAARLAFSEDVCFFAAADVVWAHALPDAVQKNAKHKTVGQKTSKLRENICRMRAIVITNRKSPLFRL